MSDLEEDVPMDGPVAVKVGGCHKELPPLSQSQLEAQDERELFIPDSAVSSKLLPFLQLQPMCPVWERDDGTVFRQ